MTDPSAILGAGAFLGVSGGLLWGGAVCGVALEAIDWAMQEGVLTVDQRNQVVREIARRTGALQRRALLGRAASSNNLGSNLSLPGLFRDSE